VTEPQGGVFAGHLTGFGEDGATKDASRQGKTFSAAIR
jgi:hypothetical protein